MKKLFGSATIQTWDSLDKEFTVLKMRPFFDFFEKYLIASDGKVWDETQSHMFVCTDLWYQKCKLQRFRKIVQSKKTAFFRENPMITIGFPHNL